MHFQWNCPEVNATIPHWWLVNIGSVKGLLPSGNQAITWTNVDHILWGHIAQLGHNELSSFVAAVKPLEFLKHQIVNARCNS